MLNLKPKSRLQRVWEGHNSLELAENYESVERLPYTVTEGREEGMMGFGVRLKEEPLVGVELQEDWGYRKQVGERELLDREIMELELRKRELECSVAGLEEKSKAKLKILEVVEGSVMEALVKLKKYQDLVVGIDELEAWKKKLESKVIDLEAYAEGRCKELESKEEKCRVQSDVLDGRERDLKIRMKKFEETVKEFNTRGKEFPTKGVHSQAQSKRPERRDRKLELRMKESGERVKAFKNMEKEFKVKEKRPMDGSGSVADDSSGTLTLEVVLNGEDVHMLLDGHKINLISTDEVSEALQLSGAPVLLVLEAIEVLYPPYLVKIDRRFKGNVGRSCILLLEQLILNGTKIESGHREHALKLALKWKDTLCLRNSLEVLAFLYLLASFNLAPSFDTKEVMKLFEIVAEHEKVRALCHRLELKYKMPGFIRKLIGKKQWILAIEYAYEFKLVDMFPPVDLLKQRVIELKSAAKKPEARELAISEEISALKEVIKCVSDHNLESEYSIDGMKERVAELEARSKKLKTYRRCANEAQSPPRKKLNR